MERYGLVLEGGGMRGAYTAGALAWLTDHNIKLDYGVGISSGAVYLVCYLSDDKVIPYQLSTHYVANPDVVGPKALLKEHHIIAYQYLFRHDLIGQEGLSVKTLKERNPDMEIGAYDLEKGETVYFNAQEIDDEMELLLASCALPIASKRIIYQGKEYIDGGVTKMIPIERAIERGCTKYLVITTKPEGYVRKPANIFMRILMRIFYGDYPQENEDYRVRHLNYVHQMNLVYDLVEKKDAILVRPTKSLKVSRFRGSPEDLQALYDLGYADMEERKEEILQFLGTTYD